MGMIANYQQIADEKLQELKNSTDLFENIEDLQENEDVILCDIDKMWDALHFLLTGKSAELLKNNLISEAIVGEFTLSGEDAEEYVAGINAYRVKEIAAALENLDFEKYIANFNMQEFATNNIYPDIWSYEEEKEDIEDDLRICYENLKRFYRQMAELNSAVLVSIY